MTASPDAYLGEHVHRALVEDGRVTELGLEAVVVGGCLVLRGAVGTEVQRQAVLDVARRVIAEEAPGLELRSEVGLQVEVDEPDEEHL